MKTHVKLIVIGLILISCKTGNLDVIADIPTSLEETSAIEKVKGSGLFWVIEDSGNKNHLYGLNLDGDIERDIKILNANNNDWEDLTSDSKGNLYVGDFGNNDNNRNSYTIYKISDMSDTSSTRTADRIQFTLPNDMKSLNFEAFFVYKDYFYLFSKGHKSCHLLKVPNTIGTHVASYISTKKFDGKHNKVTSADISDDGRVVALLNRDKLWTLTSFTGDDFFNGSERALPFDHSSQKEGVHFLNNTQVLITDERNKFHGGNMYSFDLDRKN